MHVHHLRQTGAFLYFSYGSPYYSFVFLPSEDNVKTNKVVIYDPKSGQTIYTAIFHDLEFTSMVMLGSDVYIGLTNGQILRVIQNCATRKYVISYIDSMSGWTTTGEPVTVLGINDTVVCVATSCEKHWLSAWKSVTFCRKEVASSRTTEGAVEAYKFDSESNRLLWVTRNSDGYALHTFGQSEGENIAQYRKYKMEMPLDFVMCITISTYGEVAFSDGRGRFCILNPASNKKQYLHIGCKRKRNTGGRACFVGKREEYLVYTGNRYSEIAAAKYIDDKWRNQDSLVAETSNIYYSASNSGASETSIHDLGTDGRYLVVRVGPEGGIDQEEMSNMLWIFDVDNFSDELQGLAKIMGSKKAAKNTCAKGN